jgi:peptide/nickel transport system ATP-binding protein
MERPPIITVTELKKLFPVRSGIITSIIKAEQTFVHAVDNISFKIDKGEIFCIVGESGCGKTTTARLLLMLERPTSGNIEFENHDLINMNKRELKKLRKRMQVVFQDPYSSLNPRKSVFKIISEPLEIHGVVNTYQDKMARVVKALEAVDMTPPENFIFKFPHELSGGQRQRIAIARALALEPMFIVADEPVSMIDVSMRVGILNLLQGLRNDLGITILLITHDLAVARYISDRIAVMYLGRLVEIAPADELIQEPKHPYTMALVSAVPRVSASKAERIKLKGEVPTPIDIPSGCRFRTRCPYAERICESVDPPLRETKPKHLVACHIA